MKNFKKLLLVFLAAGSMMLTSCLHIVEEVTFRKDGNGTYKMMLDMSELKGMMDMFKNMAPDSTATAEGEDPAAADNGMSQMGEQLSSVASSLKSVEGISNVVELNDTTNFQFGYTFEFKNVEALNKAIKVINKEKYDSNVEDVYKFSGKSFERMATSDLGEELKKALAEGEEEDTEGNAEMMKMFFADMTYKQIYHFPDREVKNSSNELSEIGDEGHTLTITLKPFDEEQQKKNQSVGTKVKLK